MAILEVEKGFGIPLGKCDKSPLDPGRARSQRFRFMHYNPSVLEAFNSVEHIMRDVNNG
jgi:hypothetical protein